jgi:hypothetical protein
LLVEVRFAPHSESERLAVRNGADYVDVDSVYRESYASDCWLSRGAGARVELGHGGDQIGQVVMTSAHGPWHYASLVVESDDPAVLGRIRPGAGVSLDARLINSDTNELSRTRRHKLAKLNAIAITRQGERAKVPNAQIVSVTESRTTRASSAGRSSSWRLKLPAGFEDWATFDNMPDNLDVGTTLVNHTRAGEVGIRWTGSAFTAAGRVSVVSLAA